ncbi:MAG: alpha/beta fold hydrolase [Gammaproteobacteria bacterium]|nr:alpha/beta fold hydrolase [Gammaproteobacteria bacterium]
MSLSDAYQEREIQLATGKVHLLEGGAGRTIVFLHHSWGSPGWLPVHESLAASHRVVVPDLPGWGGSERPAWAREPRDLAILGGRILEALDAGSATLVGTGFGGFVAAELATMRPLDALVLIGAAGIQPANGEILDQMLVSHRAYIEAGFRDRDAYVAWVGEEPADDVRQLWDFSREMTARVCWKPYMFNRRLAPLLGDVATPTLAIWGSEDRVVPPECATLYAEALPNCRVETIAGAGHLVEIEEAERVAGLIGAHVRTNGKGG